MILQNKLKSFSINFSANCIFDCEHNLLQPGFSSCARNSGGAALLLPKEATRGIQTSAIIFKEDATQATKDAPKDAAARAAEVVPFFEEDK